jgi:hypothetical protein
MPRRHETVGAKCHALLTCESDGRWEVTLGAPAAYSARNTWKGRGSVKFRAGLIGVSLVGIGHLDCHFSDSCLNLYMRCVISGFHREAGENCAFLGYKAASSCNLLPTFMVDLSAPCSGVKNFGFLTLQGGTDRLCRNVSKILPLLAA